MHTIQLIFCHTVQKQLLFFHSCKAVFLNPGPGRPPTLHTLCVSLIKHTCRADPPYTQNMHVRVLSLRSSVIHGFVTEPWYSHHVRVFMWARGFECARVARSLVCVPCFMLERGVWIPALMFWVSVTWRGSDTRAPFSVIVWVRGLEFARHRALLSTCVLLCCTQFVFLSAACIYVVMSCVNTWLMSFLISCVFMSCFAHGWWFVCWPCACVFVLCEHVASVLVFCVPHALVNLSWPHPSCYLVID